MLKTDSRYSRYISVLKAELVPAAGCTEPIAIAFAAAKARAVLGKMPERVEIVVSGNIIKNVKSVVVPNTGGMKGIQTAAAAGIAAGDVERILEVIADVDDAGRARIKEYLNTAKMTVRPSEGDKIFYIDLTASAGEDHSRVIISDYHTNIVRIEKNGETVYENEAVTFEGEDGVVTERDAMTIKEIIDFADTVDLDDIGETIRRQIAYNSAIAEEGLKNNYGANVGRALLATFGNDVKIRAMAAPAAGSDARMSGCELPVIIVSGSGNQGMTASLPVIEYAKEYNKTEEELIRAVILSDLITIHQKSWIGRLSAFCGAVSAGCGAAAGANTSSLTPSSEGTAYSACAAASAGMTSALSRPSSKAAAGASSQASPVPSSGASSPASPDSSAPLKGMFSKKSFFCTSFPTVVSARP